MLDLVVRTHRGSCWVRRLHPSLTVEELKKLLHETVPDEQMNIPKPENQSLVYGGHCLHNGTLGQAGIQTGDSVVVVELPDQQSQDPPDSTKVPDANTIARAIVEYAKSMGIEDRLAVEEAPKPRRRPNVASATGYDQLLSIIDALEGRIGDIMRRTGSSQLDEAEQGDDGGRSEVQVPEPNSDHMAQLMEMGFSEELSRKALLLHRNSFEGSLNWLLEHQSDPDAATPLTNQELQSLYGRPRRRRHMRDAAPELVTRLQEMGFQEQQAVSALRAFNNNVEMTVSWLLRREAQNTQRSSEEPLNGNSSRANEEAPVVAEPETAPVVENTVEEQGTEQPQDQQQEVLVWQRGNLVIPSPPTPADEDVEMEEAGGTPMDPETPEALFHQIHLEEASIEGSRSSLEVDEMAADHQHSHDEEVEMEGDNQTQEQDATDARSDQNLEQAGQVFVNEEEEEIVVGVTFEGGELGGLDLEDVERILGGGGGEDAPEQLFPRLQQLAAMEGRGTEHLSRVADGFRVLLNHPHALEEALRNPDFVDRLREVLNMLGVQESASGTTATGNAAGGGGGAGEGPAPARGGPSEGHAGPSGEGPSE